MINKANTLSILGNENWFYLVWAKLCNKIMDCPKIRLPKPYKICKYSYQRSFIVENHWKYCVWVSVSSSSRIYRSLLFARNILKTRMLISIVLHRLNLLVLDIMCLSSLFKELWPLENRKMYRNVLKIHF